jgi:hypothetical protein
LSEDRVKIHFQLEQDSDGYPPVGVESLWAVPTTTAGEFVLDNVPFFARCATLGDTVRVREEQGQRWFESVARRSTNSLIRAVFFDAEKLEQVNGTLERFGCSTEYLRPHKLLAVSIPANVSLVDVQAYLEVESGTGVLDYEEPLLRQ